MDNTYKNELRSIGVDVDAALERMVGNEDLYAKLLEMFLDDESFDNLKASFADGNIEDAFNAAHSIKGTAGNLGLDNITGPVIPMVEILRAGNSEGVAELIDETAAKYSELKSVIISNM